MSRDHVSLSRVVACVVIATMSIVVLSVFGAGAAAVTSDEDYPLITLAHSFREFEIALKDAAPGPDAFEAVSRAMDRAAFTFFSGNYDEVARQVNALTVSLRFGDDPSPAMRIAANTRAIVRPQPWSPDVAMPPALDLRCLLDAETTEPASFAIQIIDVQTGAAITLGEHIRLPAPDIVTIPLHTKIPAIEPGAYDVILVDEKEHAFRVGTWSVLTTSVSSQRDRLDAVLDDIEDPALADAIALCRQRLEMFGGDTFNDILARWVLTPARVAREVDAEVEILSRGMNPYIREPGDTWHTFTIDGLELPVRIHRPGGLGGPDELPVVIALHGAGGNEHLFFEGYGRILPDLAERFGFLAVSPLTYNAPISDDGFESLLDHLDTLHTIDRDRVYVVGHSLGSMMASGLVARHADSIAAMCGIAGTLREAGTVPTLVYGAEFDTIIRISQRDLDRVADPEGSPPVEARMVEGQGHVLVVNAILTEAIEWMLKFDRSERR